MSGNSIYEKITAIENSLCTPFYESGKPLPRLSLSERMVSYRVPGVSLAVFCDGELEWVKSYGILENGRPDLVTPHTRFQAASISKPVAALVVLRLVEEGLLDLDKDVNEYLKSWQLPENEFTRTQKVTLRRILSHSAGLTVHGFAGYPSGTAIPTLQQILDGQPPANSEAVRVDVEPGAICRYSGGGTTLAQLVVKEVTGRSYRDVAREMVLNKIGMADSGYDHPLPTDFVGTAAAGHRPDGSVLPGKWNTYPELAAAGLWTTATDLCRYAMEIQRAYAGLSQRVISQAMAIQMLTHQSERFGLGPVLDGQGQDLFFSHGGSNEGYRCEFAASASGSCGAAVMTNCDSGGDLAMEIMRAIAIHYGWAHFQPIAKTAIVLPESSLASHIGTFAGSQIMVQIELESSGKGLKADFPSTPYQGIVFLPESADHFYNMEKGVELVFASDSQGEYVDVHLSGIVLQAHKQ